MSTNQITRDDEFPRPAPQPGPFNPAKPIPPYPPRTFGGAL